MCNRDAQHAIDFRKNLFNAARCCSAEIMLNVKCRFRSISKHRLGYGNIQACIHNTQIIWFMTDAWRHPSQRTNIATGDGTAVLYRRINDITDIDTKLKEKLCVHNYMQSIAKLFLLPVSCITRCYFNPYPKCYIIRIIRVYEMIYRRRIPFIRFEHVRRHKL